MNTFKKWFEIWEIEIKDSWNAIESNGGYDNFYRDWYENYKEFCSEGNHDIELSFRTSEGQGTDFCELILKECE